MICSQVSATRLEISLSSLVLERNMAMDILKNYIILKENKPEDMIIKNIVACATLIFIITTTHGQKIHPLKRLLNSVRNADKMQIKAVCGIGLKEVSDPVGRSYIRKIPPSTSRLVNNLMPALQKESPVSR